MHACMAGHQGMGVMEEDTYSNGRETLLTKHSLPIK
jgi:hypothetical protein